MTTHGSVEEGYCPKSDDDQHCTHWWDGEACCWCSAGGMPERQKIVQGMVEGPTENPDIAA